MLDKFIYENHLGQRFDGLANGVYLNIGELRNYTWSYQTINSRISRFYRKTTNRKIPLYVVGKTDAQAVEAMNRLLDITEADVALNVPGKVFAGDYYTNGFVTVSKKANYLDSKQLCKIDLTLTSDDPAWYKDTVHAFYMEAPMKKAATVGDVITVSGASASPLLGLTLYGKTTQDGTPSPDAPSALESLAESGSVTVTIEGAGTADTQTATLTVADGLAGVPVTSGGTYTDAGDQQWTADSVEYDAEAGTAKIVRRVARITSADGFGTPYKNAGEVMWRVSPSTVQIPSAGYPAALCSMYAVAASYSDLEKNDHTIGVNRLGELLIRDDTLDSAEAVTAMLTGGDFALVYPLAEPVETELSTADFAALCALEMVSLYTKLYNGAGAWMAVTYSIAENMSGTSMGGFDYAYDYAYEYAVKIGGRNISNGTYTGNAFRLLIYGPATNPTVTIGGHSYTVNGTVAEGETLLIDSMAKTITLTTATGSTINYFDKRDRQNYIFQPIQPGQNAVTWPCTFGFELTVIEERSEPKWT